MKRGDPVRVLVIGSVLLAMITLSGARAGAPDASKVPAATGHVETGARNIGDGKIGEDVEETTKGIGNTVVEGGAVSFGQSVKTFFKRMFDDWLLIEPKS